MHQSFIQLLALQAANWNLGPFLGTVQGNWTCFPRQGMQAHLCSYETRGSAPYQGRFDVKYTWTSKHSSQIQTYTAHLTPNASIAKEVKPLELFPTFHWNSSPLSYLCGQHPPVTAQGDLCSLQRTQGQTSDYLEFFRVYRVILNSSGFGSLYCINSNRKDTSDRILFISRHDPFYCELAHHCCPSLQG
jgi:hypothetical protein